MATLPPPPDGLNLQESRETAIIVAISVTWAITVIAVSLRFLSRKLSSAPLWLDDFLTLPPLALVTALCFVSVTWMTDNGLGKHIWATKSTRASEVMMQGLFISEMVYTFTMVSVKYSISCLYYRLFKSPQMNIVLYVICGIVSCWGIALVFVVCFQCVPLRGFWDKSVESVCGVDDYKFFIGNSVPNIVTDVALLITPTVPIWRLQVTLAQKITLTGLFMMGGLVTATSITRLIYLLKLDNNSPDVTWNFSETQIWTCVELHTAIISACLPCLRPVFLWIPGMTRSLISSRRGTPSAPLSGYARQSNNTGSNNQKDILLSDMQSSDGFAPLHDVTIVHDVSVVSERISPYNKQGPTDKRLGDRV